MAASPRTKNILILFYSLTGKTAMLAREVAAGAKAIPDTTVTIKRIPELIPPAFFKKNPALQKQKTLLEKEFPLATVEDLVGADGIALGTPVHFGSFASQVKQFIDQLSPIWIEGKLVNKPVAVFCTSASLHAGEEVALVSLLVPLLNLGMIPVGIPYPIQGGGDDFAGGSPYGAVWVTGHKGEKPLSTDDQKASRILGQRLAMMTQILICDCEHCSACKSMSEKIV